MSEYVTTCVRLPAALHEALKRRAAQEGMSLTQIIRDRVAEYVLQPPSASQRPPEEKASDPFFLIGSDPGHSALGDASSEHDKYLYPKEREDR